MRTRLLRSTPLRPLSNRLSALTRRCDEVRVASAFLTEDAMLDLLDAATSAGATTNVLTGTFGNNTRKSTFDALLRASRKNARIKAAVWHCGSHGAFHAKLYLWRMAKGSGVAWIGSPNLTNGGMQNEGELALEVSAPWESRVIRQLRAGFDAEWHRAAALTPEWLKDYRESKRTAPDHRVARRTRRPSHPRVSSAKRSRYFTTNVTFYVSEGSAIEKRADRLLGSASYWMHQSGKLISKVRPGDQCLLVDLADNSCALIEITDVAKDRRARFLAYEPLRHRNPWVSWTKNRRSRLIKALGGGARGRALGTKLIQVARWQDAARVVYGVNQQTVK